MYDWTSTGASFLASFVQVHQQSRAVLRLVTLIGASQQRLDAPIEREAAGFFAGVDML